MSELRENRPEGWGIVGNWQQYFDDPALDKLAEITMDLAATTWTLIDRQKITEWILEEKGYLENAEIDTFQPSEDQEKELTEARNQFISDILNGLTRSANSEQ